MPRSWMLADLTYHDLKGNPPEVVVLPFGAVEPHNLHLPYATDVIEADAIGSLICEKANKKGARTLCLPTVPYGTETNQYAFPLSMNLQPSTLLAVLRDLVESVERSGISKLLLLNSHGGNTFKGHLRELFGRTKVQLFLCNWYTMHRAESTEIFENKDDHAGEMETSMLLHLCPELVRLKQADAGATRESRFDAVRKGWVEITRPWHLLTTNSGSGDPRRATAEKGQRWIELVSESLADFLVELSNAPIDGDFPFSPLIQ